MRYLFLLSLLLGTAFSQNLSLSLRGRLPASLAETSGLELTPQAKLWSHNDSGDSPFLYEISDFGALRRSLRIDSASNVDWEDIARDDQGNLFIGDFGNNSNNRSDLTIYRIPNPDTFSGDSVEARQITFRYPDQRGLPPIAAEQNFDAEAFFWFRDSLFIFTKNRTNPFNGYTKMYRLPDQPGDYTATLVDSFFTGMGLRESYWITAADISPDGRRMILLGYDKLWLFHCYEGSHFFRGGFREMSLGGLSQKEAVVFAGEKQFFVTDEEFLIGGRNLYRGDLGIWADSLRLELGDTLLAGGTSYALDAGYPGASYQWNTGDTTQVLQVDQDGTYQVEVSLHGCKVRDSVTVLLQQTDIEDPLLEVEGLKMTVSPHPFTDYTDLICYLPERGSVTIEVFDLNGQRLARLFFPNENIGEQRYRLSRHNLPLNPGKYLLRLTHQDRVVEKKLIKY
jgi:hypothetical protein